jgi:hypothetical protein
MPWTRCRVADRRTRWLSLFDKSMRLFGKLIVPTRGLPLISYLSQTVPFSCGEQSLTAAP